MSAIRTVSKPPAAMFSIEPTLPNRWPKLARGGSVARRAFVHSVGGMAHAGAPLYRWGATTRRENRDADYSRYEFIKVEKAARVRHGDAQPPRPAQRPSPRRSITS